MLKIAAWVGDSQKHFDELMLFMLCNEYRLAQRAAYPVSTCVERQPVFIKKWFSKLIKNLERNDIHDAVKRNTLRLLQGVNIPEKQCGALFEKAHLFLHDPDEPIAVRVFSLSVMANIAVKFPELKEEVLFNAESLLHCGIPAMESRARKIHKSIAKK